MGHLQLTRPFVGSDQGLDGVQDGDPSAATHLLEAVSVSEWLSATIPPRMMSRLFGAFDRGDHLVPGHRRQPSTAFGSRSQSSTLGRHGSRATAAATADGPCSHARAASQSMPVKVAASPPRAASGTVATIGGPALMSACLAMSGLACGGTKSWHTVKLRLPSQSHLSAHAPLR